jgi:drug/metabolite transporter (DMT)-like permease
MLAATFVWSTAGVAQRALDAGPATQVADRAVFSTLTLLALVLATERGSTTRAFRSIGRWGLVAAILWGIASSAFILSLNYTTVANVLFMQATAPMIAALLGWTLLSETIPVRTWLAISLVGAGVALMVGGSLSGGGRAVLVPFAMSAAFAGVVVITRHRREISMLPAACASQVLVVAVVGPFAAMGSATGRDWALLALLGVTVGVGLALLTVGARLIPPAEVALITSLQLVLGPLWVWLAYDERPSAATLAGGSVVAAAVLVQATGDLGTRFAASPAPAAVAVDDGSPGAVGSNR